MADITFTSALYHISKTLPSLWRFVTAGTYLLGVIFSVRAVMLFGEYGEMHVQKSAFSDIRKPLICSIIAVALLYWPSLFHSLMETVFRQDSPIGYSAGPSRYHQLIQLGGNIIEFVGFIAFVRGWLLLDRIAKQNAQPGALGKAMAHIIGGLFAINIFGTWNILRTTIGLPG